MPRGFGHPGDRLTYHGEDLLCQRRPRTKSVTTHPVDRLNFQILISDLRTAGRRVPVVTTYEDRSFGCVGRLLEDDDLMTVAGKEYGVGAKCRLVDGMLPRRRDIGSGVDLGSNDLTSA